MLHFSGEQASADESVNRAFIVLWSQTVSEGAGSVFEWSSRITRSCVLISTVRCACCISHMLFKSAAFNGEGGQYWYNRPTSNTFHLTALSLYSRLMLPNKRTKYMCSWKGAHLKGCWSIMKTVWHYSNCCEPLYLYLLDNAMFRWLCVLWGQRGPQKFLYGLNGTLVEKREHWSATDRKQDARLNESLRQNITCDAFTRAWLPSALAAPRESSLAWKKERKILLCALWQFNGVIYDSRGGNVGRVTSRKPAEDKIMKQDIGNTLRWCEWSKKPVNH